jgi:hypothetical protein
MLDRLSQKSSVLSSILLKGLDNYGEVRSAHPACLVLRRRSALTLSLAGC